MYNQAGCIWIGPIPSTTKPISEKPPFPVEVTDLSSQYLYLDDISGKSAHFPREKVDYAGD